MTLNEGIKALMSSDSYNNALVHDSWTDGRYIQTTMKYDQWGNPIDKVIKVLSSIDKDLGYSEQKFSRKQFDNIKNYGWTILSAEGLVRYISKVSKKPKVEEQPKVEEPEKRIVTDEDKQLVYGYLKAEFDIDDLPVEETAYLNKIVDAVLYDKEVPYHYSAESVYDDSITDVIGLVGQAQHPELYKMLHHLGLTKQDLEWVHSIELEEKIFVYVDDLDDFENQAAINLAKKRIHNALERKNK